MALVPSAAQADTVPPNPATPVTASADALPTVQINGIVYDQVIVGNTVVATGEFTSARPAGSPRGTNETPRSNILAYNLTTGELLPNWNPALNAAGRSLAVSADGTRVFVGGSFTQVNGVNRYRLAAIDVASGALVTNWAPTSNSRVSALAISGNTLYLGGIFGAIGNQTRTRLAAVDATTGAVLAWAPTANAEPLALVAPAGSGKVVIGGKFTQISGVNWYGMGAVDATSGALLPWAATSVVRNAGDNAAIYSLSTDANQVYGSGYTFGSGGNLENTFAAKATDGSLVYVSGCRGDTYDTAPVNGVLYHVGHPHDCSTIGGHPQTDPWTYQHATAQTTTAAPSGLLNNGGNFSGRPAPELLQWLPTLDTGNYSGANQAAWTVTGNSDYVILGGEFPKVNGVAQEGLVRFAVKDKAPNKEGPQGLADLTPTLAAINPGGVRITWKAAWDRDNRRLTYQVLRGTTVVGQTTRDTTWWNRPTMSFVDNSSPTGAQTYRIRVTDPMGNVITGATAPITVATAGVTSKYTTAVRADGAQDHWRLDEASGSTAYDWSGGDDLTLSGTTRNQAGGLSGDPDAATKFSGGTAPGYTKNQAFAPDIYTEEAWFKTSTTSGGKIIGFGDKTNSSSATYDRHVYMTNSGTLIYGVLSPTQAQQTVSTTTRYNDNQWHHVAASLGADGMKLYVDGALVASNAGVTQAYGYLGYWRVGGDNLGSLFGTSWPSRPSSAALNGTIDDVAIYPTALSAAAIQRHYQVGKGIVVNQPPTASFTSSATAATASFNGSASTDPDGTIASYEWNFGDGTTGTGATTSHDYTASGTYTVTLTVTDNGGATASTTSSVTVTVPAPNQLPTASFTATPTGLSAALDAAASSDPDGTIASYAWNFGDGTTGTGVTTTKAYAAAGTYTVTLTVTDDRGGSATTTRDVTVAPVATGTAVATDTFERTVASGLGTADVGGAWTSVLGGATVSVTGGAAQASVPAGKTTSHYLRGISNQDTDLNQQFWFDSAITGTGSYYYSVVRSTAAGDYRVKMRFQADGSASAQLVKVVGGVETALTSQISITGGTPTATSKLNLRVQASGAGPTTLRYHLWRDGTTEPTTWSQTVTDSTDGLQVAGAVGFLSYSPTSVTTPVIFRLDNLSATRL